MSAFSHSHIWSFDPNADLLSKTDGAFAFALSLCVWYLLLVQMFEAVDFPINLPVDDLSVITPGRSIKALRKREHEYWGEMPKSRGSGAIWALCSS
jgi:hypothetical protein